MIAVISARRTSPMGTHWRWRGFPGMSPVAMVIIPFLAAGCTATAPLKPEPISTKIDRISWPTPTVITVIDARSDRVASDALQAAVASTLRGAIRAPAAPCPCQTLTVTVFRHEASFAGGGSGFWHGLTIIGAILRDAGGAVLGEWSAEDQDEQWNVWGPDSGRRAAQQSLRDALRKLLERMKRDRG